MSSCENPVSFFQLQKQTNWSTALLLHLTYKRNLQKENMFGETGWHIAKGEGGNRTSVPAGSPSISAGKEQPKCLPTSKCYIISACSGVDLLAFVPVGLNLRSFLWKLKVEMLAPEILQPRTEPHWQEKGLNCLQSATRQNLAFSFRKEKTEICFYKRIVWNFIVLTLIPGIFNVDEE